MREVPGIGGLASGDLKGPSGSSAFRTVGAMAFPVRLTGRPGRLAAFSVSRPVETLALVAGAVTERAGCAFALSGGVASEKNLTFAGLIPTKT